MTAGDGGLVDFPALQPGGGRIAREIGGKDGGFRLWTGVAERATCRRQAVDK